MDISKPLMLAPDDEFETRDIELDKIYNFCMNVAAKAAADNRRNAAEEAAADNRDWRKQYDSDNKEKKAAMFKKYMIRITKKK